MTRQLILIRHSVVEQQPNLPSKQWRLSANGRLLAAALAPKIAPYHPTRFITSTEPKAQETGQIIADLLNVPYISAANLHEHDRIGASYLPNKAAFAALVERFFREPEVLVFGRETAVQAQTRFINAVNTIMTTYPDDTIAIVTHGTVLTLFAAYHQPQLDTITFWKNLALPCAFVTNLPDVRELRGV